MNAGRTLTMEGEKRMLVLTRKIDEKIDVIDITSGLRIATINVLGMLSGIVSLDFTVPPNIRIIRTELLEPEPATSFEETPEDPKSS